MEPEIQSLAPEVTPIGHDAQVGTTTGDATGELIPGEALLSPEPDTHKGVHWFFVGSEGLRAGWSALVFAVLETLFLIPLGLVANWILQSAFHLQKASFTPVIGILQELAPVFAILGAGAIVAFIEGRRLLDYNLTGPRRSRNFAGGLVAAVAQFPVVLFLVLGRDVLALVGRLVPGTSPSACVAAELVDRRGHVGIGRPAAEVVDGGRHVGRARAC